MKNRFGRIIGLALATVLSFDAVLTGGITANTVYADELEEIVYEDYDSEDEAVQAEDEIVSEEAELIIDESDEIEDVESEDIISEDVEEVVIDDEIIDEDIVVDDDDDYGIGLPMGGLMDVTIDELDDEDSVEVIYDVDALYEEYMAAEDGAGVGIANWNSCSTNYIYNKLPANKQKAWVEYEVVCQEALTTSKNYTNAYFAYLIIPDTFTSLDDFSHFFTMFKYSHPEYFFLSNGISGSVSAGMYSFGMYENMMDGTVREYAKGKFDAGIAKVKAKINYSTTDKEVLFKSIHDAIVESVTYNQEAVDTNHKNEQEELTQSCYSTFVFGTTVCAGYALGMSLLCNDAGIDCVGLTSTGHAYNRVRINDTWYNVDATWADQSSGIYYKYYLKSTSTYSSDGKNHVPLSYWNSYLPTCTRNVTASGYSQPGKAYVPSESACRPIISIDNGVVTIKAQQTGTEIYYTTNGDDPSPASVRCRYYKSSFSASTGTIIKAIVVKDGYFDSCVTEDEVGSVRYKITYNLNGGTQDSGNPTSYAEGTGTITLASPKKTGHVFGGWYTDSAFSSARVISIDTEKPKNYTLYAKWTPVEYVLVLSSQGVKYTRYTDCVYGTSYPIRPHSFERRGYTLDNWNTKADGTGTKYSDTASVKNLGTSNAEVVTLYAQWIKNKYKITYSLNGGTISIPNKTAYYVDTPSFTLNSPTKKGYIFGGWYTDSKFTSTRLTKINTSNLKNYSLYAKWTPIKYKLVLSSQGSTSTRYSSCSYGTSYPIQPHPFTRKGYTLNNWNTKADGKGTKYSDTSKIKNLTTKDGATITLYAQWVINTYRVTYNLNGGKNSKQNKTSYTINSSPIYLEDPTKTGYIFEGWYTDPKCSSGQLAAINPASLKNYTLYAKWTPIKYKLVLNSQGSTVTRYANCKYGTDYTIQPHSFTRKGYTLSNWNTKADGKGKKYSDTAKVKNLTTKDGATVTLYAQWVKTKYKITYNLNGGSNNTGNSTYYYFDSATITFKNPTRKGYTFGGWYSDAEFKTPITKIETGSTGNKSVYAKWTANKYNIKFAGNGANSGSMGDMTSLKYGSSYTIPANGYRRTGYTFVGWSKSKISSTASYKTGASIKNLTATNGDTVTLYAVWKKQ